MKTPLVALFALVIASARAFAGDPVPAPLPTAVFEAEAVSPALKERAAQFSALLLASLSSQPEMLLVERAQLDVALGELSLGASGMADPTSAAKVGRLTGAKVLVSAKVIGTTGEMTVVAKVVGTETGRVFAVSKVVSGGDATTAAHELAVQVAKTVKAHAAELVAPVEDTAAREARLRAMVAGKTLPAVTVSIPEQHLTRPVRDPAAETEIARTLGTLGFTLLESSAAEKATIRITGEAISEMGMRRGDFVSCRARVEVKVVEIATGKILLQDRQTEVAADISEALAAKTALEHAGAKLAERIVPAILSGAK
ncbi:MAG: curli assembly protein CsgG [Opitutaceae bacterium]|nr:curli assembly protein CsgG [Opitutaceae bacterium]